MTPRLSISLLMVLSVANATFAYWLGRYSLEWTQFLWTGAFTSALIAAALSSICLSLLSLANYAQGRAAKTADIACRAILLALAALMSYPVARQWMLYNQPQWAAVLTALMAASIAGGAAISAAGSQTTAKVGARLSLPALMLSLLVLPLLPWVRDIGLEAADRSSPRPPQVSAESEEGAARFVRWYAAHRVAEPPGAELTVTEFIDYTCEVCKHNHASYRNIVATLSRTLARPLRLDVRVYPLEPTCNRHIPKSTPSDDGFDPRANACEAAIAVKAATRRGASTDEFEQWLLSINTLHKDAIESTMTRLRLGSFPTGDEYQRALTDVGTDVDEAARLGVSGTPAFVLRGVALPPPSSLAFRRTVEFEARSQQ